MAPANKRKEGKVGMDGVSSRPYLSTGTLFKRRHISSRYWADGGASSTVLWRCMEVKNSFDTTSVWIRPLEPVSASRTRESLEGTDMAMELQVWGVRK